MESRIVMTPTNTPFEEGLDEILNLFQSNLASAHRAFSPNDAFSDANREEAKAALSQLHKAAIVAELEAIRNVKGETVDAWASPAYQMLLDRIEQYKKEGK